MVEPIMALEEPDDRLYDTVARRIRSLIEQKDISPGDRLPSERRLARQFGVSRNSVREALRVLAETGVVVTHRGDGTYVRPADPDQWVDPMRQAIGLHSDRIWEIFQLRRILEPEIAALAAIHIRSDQIERLKVIVCDQDRQILQGQDGAEMDAAFHMTLAEASGNRVIAEVLKTVGPLIMESRSPYLQTESRKRRSVTAHLKMITAVSQGDAEAARTLMAQHIDEAVLTVFSAPFQVKENEK